MKRVALVTAFFLIAAFLVIDSLANTVQAAHPKLDTGGRGQPEQVGRSSDPLPAVIRGESGSLAKLALPAAPNVVLLDQYNSPLNNYIVSANRTDNPPFSAEAADDFVVPAGETWQINQVDVRSPAGFPNPTSFNVYIYTDSDTLPGTAVYSATNLAVGGTNPNYIINLTPPANVASGTYWVAVQGNIVGANWYWQGRSVLNNNSTAWREAGGYATGCLNWTRLTTCSGFTWPGQMFRLHGTIGGGGSPTTTAVPSSTSTATVIPTLTNTQTSMPTSTTTPTAVSTSTSVATSTAPAATATTGQATATACTMSFTDVPVTDTFYANIRCLACRGIIGGYNDGTFRPNNNITRGQIAKMVSNSAGFSEPITGQSFEDVPTGSPFYEFIERLYRRGHMGGYPCGQRPTETCIAPENRPYFRPNEDATRGQLSKIVSNAAGYSEPHTTQFYTDVTGDNPFYLEIMRLTTRGVMSGYPCGGENEPCDGANRPYFRWANPLTRGQASKIVANTFFPSCQIE
jgi:hypothetical protein